MQHLDYLSIAEETIQQIRKGAFLTVLAGDDLNVMTIGWASIGFLWGRPVMTIMVRKSRYTFSLIERTDNFTVTVPKVDAAAHLEYCGTKSGKKVDKLQECNLEVFPSHKVHTPIVNLPGVHFECGIVYKSAIEPTHLVDSYTHLYPEKDYHTFYYGEIKQCYTTADEVA